MTKILHNQRHCVVFASSPGIKKNWLVLKTVKSKLVTSKLYNIFKPGACQSLAGTRLVS